jgi:uncharacterized phosphosugar-binding protein
MIGARAYAAAVLPRLETLIASQIDAIEEVGRRVAASLAAGHRVWVTQTSHTVHLEATHRAGGLMAVHVLEEPEAIEPGDVVIVATSAGTTEGVVGLALDARRRGATVIALTSVDFELDPRLTAERPAEGLLHQAADVVIDLASPYGDGEFTLPGTDIAILPSTGATGVMALWMIFAEATAMLLVSGLAPLVWQSNLLPGAIARNAATSAEYARTRRGARPAQPPASDGAGGRVGG